MLTCDCESGRYLLPCMPPITTTSVIIEPHYISDVINRLIIKYISVTVLFFTPAVWHISRVMTSQQILNNRLHMWICKNRYRLHSQTSEASPRSLQIPMHGCGFTRPDSKKIMIFQIDSNQYRGTENVRHHSQRFYQILHTHEL